MSKKSHFKGPFDKQHGKRAQALLKPPSQHFYHIHWSLATKLCSKRCLLLTCVILGPLVNTLAADEKYPVLNRDNLAITIQMQLSQKQKTFSASFTAFFKFRLNFDHSAKKDDLKSFCFSEITDSENVVREISKKSRCSGSFDKQHGKREQALLKSASQHLYHIHQSLPRKLSWKRSLCLTWEILGLVVKTLAADEKYLVLHNDNLTIPIQMQLSEKQKTFSQFSAALLKCISVCPKLRTPKMWLDKCLKSPVLEDPSTRKVINVPKH